MAFNFLSQVDPNIMIFGSLFVIFLMLFLWALGKTMKDNPTIKTIISFVLALFATWGISRSRFDPARFLSSIGVSDEFIYKVAPFLFLIFLFLIGLKSIETGEMKPNGKPKKKRKFFLSRMLIVLGILMMTSAVFRLVYQTNVVLYVGILFTILGAILGSRRKKKEKSKVTPQNINPNANNAPDVSQLRKQGLATLTQAAQNFKKWARSQPNPKIVGSWAMFINFLKQNNWGRNEKEICERMHISRNDFVRVFNRYGKV